ncbi:MAG: PQQ-binding-like beta-propeller repeat protein, partial [Candidatus Poribacteria bacterium]|nr:PQQ-binding-like beta-propeller repeat protein [Candidatus Poribacteria bacterium]
MMRLLGVMTMLAMVSATAVQAEWQSVRGNLRRDGNVGYAVNPPYKQAWMKEFPGEITTTRVEAIVGGGLVYVGTYHGTLHALDAASGAERWTYSAGAPILHSPAYADGAVYFGTARGKVIALNADGSHRWTFDAGRGGVDTSP